jgi:hypothetical protein
MRGNFGQYGFIRDVLKLLVTETVSGGIPRNLVHPCNEMSCFPVTACISEHAHERLLHQIFTRGRCISELAEKVVQLAVMPREQHRQLLWLALANKQHEFMIS